MDVSAGPIAVLTEVGVSIKGSKVEAYVLLDVGTAVPVIVAGVETAGGRSERAGKTPPWGRENASKGSKEATNKKEDCILTVVLLLLLLMIQRIFRMF